MAEVTVVGGGVAGISAACYAAKNGHRVTLIDNHDSLGGRLRTIKKDGFIFDMGPSWYWMPDIFEAFFEDHGFDLNQLIQLHRLDPSYRVFWKEGSAWNMPAAMTELCALFEKEEKGAGQKLQTFLKDAQAKYEISMGDFVKKPALSFWEFVNPTSLKFLLSGKLLGSLSKEIDRLFSSEKIKMILEFPVLFLGSTAKDIPQMYSLMNYADMGLGTWYPEGGMNQLVQAMQTVLDHYSIRVELGTTISGVEVENGAIAALETNKGIFQTEKVIWAADYHHFDTKIVPSQFQSYSNSYWDSRVLAPSSLLFYIGVNQKVAGLQHHNLFFDSDFEPHISSIYETADWPETPLFYVCSPSKTDDSVAPEGCENLFILVPIATDLDRDENKIEKYYQHILERLEQQGVHGIRGNEIVKETFFVNDFKKEYNSQKGNAYGLANTLTQTAFLKPKMKSKTLTNLWFAGQMTNPGPGLPPSIISGEIAAKLVSE